jgi:nucleoside-diphosphate-sugar epimerase
MQRVLVTGAYGLIGNDVYRRLNASPERYQVHGLVRRRAASERISPDELYPIPDNRLHIADLEDAEAVQRAVEGMDVVVHLAAEPNGDAGWERVLPSNIVGGYNIFEACRLAGVKRLVYASTIQVITGYLRDEPYSSLMSGRLDDVPPGTWQPIRADQAPRPVNLYGASKVFGEMLAHVFAYSKGLPCLCVRIGWVVAEDRPPARSGYYIWCSRRDMAQLFERCVEAPAGLSFGIFFGMSDNAHNVADIGPARTLLGYAPQDRAEMYPWPA